MSSALSISQLTKRYDNGFEALKGVDLTVESGDFYALLGPNGAGKSTTLGIVCGLVQPTSGTVSVSGFDVQKEAFQARLQLGVVPQEINLNPFEKPMDIITNQAGYFGLRAKKVAARAEELLRALELWDKRFEMVRMLSGGMKRRVMIARALIHNPSVLILDEPTAGVDIELRRSMWEFMQALNEQGTTIVLTTHYLEEAEKMCRNIAIIDHGQIVEACSMRTLLSQLETEHFVLDVHHTLDESAKQSAFLQAPFGLSFGEEQTVEVALAKGQSLNDVFALLSEKGISVHSMRTKNNRLEDLFVDLINKERA